ncbi:MAG: endolytic transglycosylase MltG [Sulfuriflexus sp.]|nr:endolytic transglycosylase MltG [Sulfuriflexus sp.]
MRIRNWLVASLLVFVGVSLLVAYNYKQFMTTPFSISADETIRLDVGSGRSIKSIAAELKDKGVIAQSFWLEWVARINGQARRIQAGEYEIKDTITPKQFLTMLVNGDVVQYSVTIIEGWNVTQTLQAIKNNTDLKQTLDSITASQLMKKLGLPADLHAEGWLFPDTYYFIRGESDVKVLLRAHKAMQANLNKAWMGRDAGLPYDTPYDALIMASIVEKETGKASERPQIAGVFVRRLRKRMKLQTDPTVIYGIGEKYDGNIRRRDLRKDTPYNTYTRKGMPPTPIAMPGLAAIEAALHPADGTALYFVAKGDGSHVFSTTLQQHNEAVIKYQLKGKRKAFSSFKAVGKKQ